MSKTLAGKVIEISSDGSLVTDISSADLKDAPRDASLRIVVDEHETFGLYSAEHGQPSMTLIGIVPDSGPLRIELVDDSASAMLGVGAGAAVKVSW